MNRTKNKLLAVGLSLVALLSACQKEPSGRLELIAEGMGGNGTKMTVDGIYSYWQMAEVVNINGSLYALNSNGSQAYVEGDFSAGHYYIVYPSSIYRGRSGDIVTVNMPDTYLYNTTNGTSIIHGGQVLNAPMAYSGNATGGKVLMKHLTGALDLQITKPNGLIIDSITISTTENYIMSGEMQYDLSDFDNIGFSATNPTSHNSIRMRFNSSSTPDYYSYNPNVTNNTTVTVQIPVPVFAGDAHFIVKVWGRRGGTKHIFERTQTTGGHLGRGVLGRVVVNLCEGEEGVTTAALFNTNSDGYYEINSVNELLLMEELMTNGINYRDEDGDRVSRSISYNGLYYNRAKYLVTRDINMSGISFVGFAFSGEFNGGGHTISNLTLSVPDGVYCGLFYVGSNTFSEPVKVCNVTFANLTTKCQPPVNESIDRDNYIGSLFSYIDHTTIVENVHITNFRVYNYNINNPICIWGTDDYAIYGHDYIGGFAGHVYSANLSISNSSITFAANQDFCSGGCRYMSIGGICGRVDIAPCVLSNVTVDFGTMNYNAVGQYCFGGLSGVNGLLIQHGSVLSSYGEGNPHFNATCTNVTVTGNISHNDGNGVFRKVTPTINSYAGVDVSGLTITTN